MNIPKVIVSYINDEGVEIEVSNPETYSEMLMQVIQLTHREDIRAVKIKLDSLGGTNVLYS